MPTDFVPAMFAAMVAVNCTILSEVPTTNKLILVWFYLNAVNGGTTRWYYEANGHHFIQVYRDPCHREEGTNYMSVDLPQGMFPDEALIWVQTQIKDAGRQMLHFCMEVYMALHFMQSRLLRDVEPHPSREATALHVVWRYFYMALGPYRTDVVNPRPFTTVMVFENCLEFEKGKKQVVRFLEDVDITKLPQAIWTLFEQTKEKHEKDKQEQQQQSKTLLLPSPPPRRSSKRQRKI
jgi:hypothetical protein